MTAETCRSGKIGYPDRKAAYWALLTMWRQHSKGRTERRERNAYLCTRCGQWHLTSLTQAEWDARTKARTA